MDIMDESCKDCLHYDNCKALYIPYKVMDSTCKFCLYYNSCKQNYKDIKRTLSREYRTQVRE